MYLNKQLITQLNLNLREETFFDKYSKYECMFGDVRLLY